MLEKYMHAMAKVVDGSDARALERLKGTGFDPKFAAVYRNNSVCALSEVLEANYLSVLNVVGEEYFLKLVKRYISKYPAMQRTLVNYGADFERLIDADKEGHRLPYLGDFARLDRAWTLSHVAKDASPLEIAALTKMAEAGIDLEALTLNIMPGVSLVELSWPIFSLWEKIRKEEETSSSVSLEKTRQTVLVWRYEYAVNYRILQPAEFSFLKSIKDGQTLGQAMNNAILSLPSKTPEAGITTLLPNAVGAELFINITG